MNTLSARPAVGLAGASPLLRRRVFPAIVPQRPARAAIAVRATNEKAMKEDDMKTRTYRRTVRMK